MTITYDALCRCGLPDLEELFCADTDVRMPTGCFRGRTITRLTNPGTTLPTPRFLEYIGFEVAPFGIDFRSNCWYFLSPRMQAGRFTPTVRRSRWRSMTTVVTLEYGVSKLPRRMREFLYDEVKPISDTLCLGLGGINAEKDAGDHFFFALERIR